MIPNGGGSRLLWAAGILAAEGIGALVLQLLATGGIAVHVTSPLSLAAFLLFVVLFLWAGIETQIARASRRTARIRGIEGKCIACGYELTGNASGVCPECGQPTTQSRAPNRATPDADYARPAMWGFAAVTCLGILFAIFGNGMLFSLGLLMTFGGGSGVLGLGLQVWLKRQASRAK